MTRNNISNIANFCTRNGNLTVCSLCRNITVNNTAASDSDAATSPIFSVCPKSRSSDIRLGHLNGTTFGTEIAEGSFYRTTFCKINNSTGIIYSKICQFDFPQIMRLSISIICFCLYTKCPPHK